MVLVQKLKVFERVGRGRQVLTCLFYRVLQMSYGKAIGHQIPSCQMLGVTELARLE